VGIERRRCVILGKEYIQSIVNHGFKWCTHSMIKYCAHAKEEDNFWESCIGMCVSECTDQGRNSVELLKTLWQDQQRAIYYIPSNRILFVTRHLNSILCIILIIH